MLKFEDGAKSGRGGGGGKELKKDVAGSFQNVGVAALHSSNIEVVVEYLRTPFYRKRDRCGKNLNILYRNKCSF